LPTPLPSRGKAAFSDAEMKRRNIYEALLDRGAESLPALLAGLRDPDVRLRRNVALAFGVLSGGWWHFECGPAKVDIQPALSGLVTAFRDPDDDVRAWAAQAVGNMGANAAGAVGPLIACWRAATPALVSAPAWRSVTSAKPPGCRRCARRCPTRR
jgi:HEAT repeat protein